MTLKEILIQQLQLPDQFLPYAVPILIGLTIISVWETTWKIIAGWKAAQNNQKIWFVLIIITNTIGILPIVYYYFFQDIKSKASKKKKR